MLSLCWGGLCRVSSGRYLLLVLASSPLEVYPAREGHANPGWWSDHVLGRDGRRASQTPAISSKGAMFPVFLSSLSVPDQRAEGKGGGSQAWMDKQH